VPAGGSAGVSFSIPSVDETYDAGEVTPVSATEIRVKAPNLSAFAKDIAKGQAGLVADVTITLSDKASQTVTSPVAAGDMFTFQTLAIASGQAATFTVGKHGSFEVTAQGGEPLTLSESGSLPEGVSFTDGGGGSALLAGTPAAGTAGVYEFTIRASNGVEPDATQNFTLTVQDVPGAPQGVTATAGVEAASVSWSPPAGDGQSAIEAYVVTARPGGKSVTVAGSASSASVEGLSPGTAYTLSVAAKNALGEGPVTESAAVVPTSTAIENPESATSSTPGGTATTEPVTASGGSTLSASADGEGTVNVGTYASDPVAQLGDASSFFDVATNPGSSFNTVTFKICGVAANATIEWWSPVSHAWAPVSSQSIPSGTPLCVTVTVDASTTPSLAELSGTIFAVTAPATCAQAPAITEQPESTAVAPHKTATFKAAASTPASCSAPTVQWYEQAPGASSFSAIAGATATTYTTPATTSKQNGARFQARFTNSFASTTSEPATLSVSPGATRPLKLSPASLKAATATRAYHARFITAGGSAPYNFHEHGVPAGLSWQTSGEAQGSIELAGTPTTAGTTTIVIEAADSSKPARTVRREYTLTVQLALPASLGKATVGSKYSRQLTSAGGTAPYHFSLTAGTLPEGLELTASGLLSGTPTDAGNYAFAITVTDSANPALTFTGHYKLPVALGLTPPALPAGKVGVAYGEHGAGITIVAQGGTAPYLYEALTPLPLGLTLTGGLLAGKPETEGTYALTIRVTDSATPALTRTQKYTIKIKGAHKLLSGERI